MSKRKADREYAIAVKEAAALPLTQKIQAIKLAKQIRQLTYDLLPREKEDGNIKQGTNTGK